MSKYGLKIKNIEAGSLYGYNIGVRENYDYTNAMFTNSLFSDFLIKNGLNIWKEESTRDIVCIEFNYGVRSYEDEIKHLDKTIKKVEEDEELTEVKKEIKIAKLNKIKDTTKLNKGKYKKVTAQQIRDIFYTQGVEIEYLTRNKKKEIIKAEKIKYKMLYRTPGKAKKGSCMFINEKLYDIAIDFLYMGISLPEENSPIVEMGAYSSLITSSIVDKIQIEPENILILKDVDSFFETKIISVETDENKHCMAKTIEKYKLKNTLFDGQALIESSIFPEDADGYILLRHHLTKMAAFCSNIQLFFKDYFGNKYETAKVTDMWGNEHYAKDIKMITTDNAIKWLKFNVSYEYWCKKVHENDCMFGIVKTAHKSKLGEVQRMSYQMINALDINIMDKVVQCSKDYIEKLKKDNNEFLKYLKDNSNFSNDYEVLIALCEQDKDFVRSEYFRDRKNKIIETYILNLKNGKIIQNADNLVIVGSPYAMLLHAVGEDVENDDTFNIESNTIQCHTKRFDDGEYLACFRNPFNSKNNMGYLHNVYHEKFDKYFVFGKQIVAVNMIHTDFQDRNNGSDQDSDSIYTTNQIEIVECAKNCYLNYPTIVNNIPKEKNSYNNSLINYSNIDNNLSAAQLAIGESSNLAQICLTYTYNFDDQKYHDYVCILSVLAQVAIDNAKRRFDIDLNDEISRIKSDMNIVENGYPSFWTIIKKPTKKTAKERKKQKENLKAKVNRKLQCPMNCIFDIKIKEFKPKESTMPMSDFFVKYELEESRRKSKKVEELIEKYSFDLSASNSSNENEDEKRESYLLLRNDFDELIKDIKSIYISKNYIGLFSWLINRAFCIGSGVKSKQDIMQSKINLNKSILIKVLYEINPEALLKCFSCNINKKMNNDQI